MRCLMLWFEMSEVALAMDTGRTTKYFMSLKLP